MSLIQSSFRQDSAGAGAGVEDRIEAMTTQIAELLVTVGGDAMLRKLFWEILDFERVNQPMPLSALPQTERCDVLECSVFARCDQLPVCVVKLNTSELSAKMEQPILRRLGRAWTAVLTVFSNFSGTEWDFCWQ